MKKLDVTFKKSTSAGIAATTVLAIGTCVAAGISLLTNVVFGSLNIANAAKQRNSISQIEFSKNTTSNTIMSLV